MNTVFSEFYFIYKDLKVDYEDNFNKQSLRDTFSKNHIFWEIGKKKFSIFKFFF